jgi:hypothetical protein
VAKDKRKIVSGVNLSERPHLLGAEQYRYCSILVAAGAPLDAQHISEVYAQRRGEAVNYTKTYNQLLGLSTMGVLQKLQTRRPVPPHNALRVVNLWQLTSFGEKIYIATEKSLHKLLGIEDPDNPSR